MTVRATVLAVGFAAVVASMLHGQARSAPDWTTQGFDAQRTSWMRVDPYISPQNLDRFQFIWKLKLDNEPRHGNSLTAPVALGNLMTFRGFKSLIFVGGSSNNVYAIDYDFGTLFWRTHHNYAAGAREYAGSPTCPGGMTLPLTRRASTPRRSFLFSDLPGRRARQRVTWASRAGALHNWQKSQRGLPREVHAVAPTHPRRRHPPAVRRLPGEKRPLAVGEDRTSSSAWPPMGCCDR
jgi:hypothetical protein